MTNGVSEDDILITHELFERSPRQPDLAAENQVLRSLGQQLIKPPHIILKHFAEIARELCQAGAAGVSLVEVTPDGEEVFRWVALSGTYEPFQGNTTPRNFSPCGSCLDQRNAQLYSHPERYFTYLQSLTPPPVEMLMVPLLLADRNLGTIWVVTHEPQRQFDREDARVLASLTEFLAVALSSAQARQIAEERQEALRESEARFQTLVTNMPGMVYRYNGNTESFTYVSSCCRKLLELEPEAILEDANALWTLVHPDDSQSLKDSIAAAIRDFLPWQWEGRIITPSGQLKWIQGSSSSEETSEGAVWDGLLFDISDRKQTEEALRDQKARLHLILESAKDYAIFTLDLKGRITSWNAGAKRLLGYEEAEIVGESGRIIFTPEDSALGEHERELQIAFTQGRKENERWHVRKDRSRFWGSGLVMPLRDEDNSVRGFVKIMQDKTIQRQSEEALRQSESRLQLALLEREQLLAHEQAAREEAEAANRIKDEFLAVLSHELRSPLNPILGWIGLLRNGRLNAAKTAYALETIERNARLQTQLIEDLLDISRILRGKLTFNRVPVNLAAIISAALETVRLAAEAKSIDLQFTILAFGSDSGQFSASTKADQPSNQPNPGTQNSIFLVLGDSARLQQVVWNLLSNAIKFTPNRGKVEVRLTQIESDRSESERNISSPAAPTYAQIQVSDTGKGIPADFLPHVFEHFRQADSTTTRQFGGLGLGLAIARQLVELHGGTIQVESPGEDQGATFTVRLPLFRDEREAASNKMTNLFRSPPLPSLLSGVRILLVDDEADARDLISFILKGSGAEVSTVGSASEALEVFRQTKVDVLVSDIGMPDMDGYMLMQQIRAMPEGERISAIAVTAYAGEVNQQQVLAAGFQQHIAKPIEPVELVQAIARLKNAVGR
ncbi:PAS domain S-box protein [Cyanobacteria bacterium FACHB-471]|nr:PAS domain S-box protein [Cyanobacteria bacterium FACHB-471]